MEGRQSLLLKLSAELRKVGFAEKAALVYAALLEMGSAYPSRLAEYTRLNRTTVYKVLNDLCMKGLVTEIDKNNKLCYQLEKPARLLNFVKRQIGLAEERYETAQQLFPQLKDWFAKIPDKPSVRFFEGIEGIMAVYEDHIETEGNREMVIYRNAAELQKFLPARFLNKYIKARADQGIRVRGIFPDTEKDVNYIRLFRTIEKRYWPKFRYIPHVQFPYKSEITVYGDNKVSIVNFHERSLIGIIIEDQTINQMMRMVFDLSWSGVEYIKTNNENVADVVPMPTE
jgi:sugar-specific transcriptional regulator TrmB